MEGKTRRNDLAYPELSYKINGVLFKVFSDLGPGLLEKHYEKAIAIAFDSEGIKFYRQYYVPIIYNKQVIGKRFIDFFIEDKIILELKKGQFIPAYTIRQTVDYLKLLHIKLGVVACFTNQGVFTKRILNLY